MTLSVVIAAAFGAVCRFWFERMSARRLGHGVPWGTLAVNVLGSALLGWVLAGDFSKSTTEVVVSFTGAFTTFGGFVAQSVERMANRQARLTGLLYLIATVVLSVGAAWAAFALNG